MEKNNIYKLFIDGITELGYDHEYIKKWIYAGSDQSGFDREKWYAVMGHDVEIPCEYGDITSRCVCGHKIVKNYYIVNPEKTNYLIIGSECINNFTDISSRKINRTCKRCNITHHSRKNELCKDCRKNRYCKKCDNKLKKGQRGKYCSERCEFPEKYCKCGNPKKLYKDKLMRQCFECYKKDNPDKYCECGRSKGNNFRKKCLECINSEKKSYSYSLSESDDENYNYLLSDDD